METQSGPRKGRARSSDVLEASLHPEVCLEATLLSEQNSLHSDLGLVFCGPQTETQDSLDDSLPAHGEEGVSCSEFSLSIRHAVFHYLNVSVRRAWVVLQKQTAKSRQLRQRGAVSRTSCTSTGVNRGVC